MTAEETNAIDDIFDQLTQDANVGDSKTDDVLNKNGTSAVDDDIDLFDTGNTVATVSPPNSVTTENNNSKRTLRQLIKSNVRLEEDGTEGLPPPPKNKKIQKIGGRSQTIPKKPQMDSEMLSLFDDDDRVVADENSQLFGDVIHEHNDDDDDDDDGLYGIGKGKNALLDASADDLFSMIGGGTTNGGTNSLVSSNLDDILMGREVVETHGMVTEFHDAYKYTPKDNWKPSEEKEFYQALRFCGPDLMLVQAHLVGWTYDQVRRKYKIEMKRNPNLLMDLLENQIPFSTVAYTKLHGKTL